MRTVGLCSLAVVTAVFLSAGARSAAAGNNGFAVSGFAPSERGSDWFTLESLDLRAPSGIAVGVVGDYVYRPLVIYDDDGSVRASVIRNQVIAHLGAAFTLRQRFRLAIDVPVAWGEGHAGTVDEITFSPPSGFALGDIRLGADVRLFGRYGDVLTGAVGAQMYVPSGSTAGYVGDGNVRFVPRFTLAGIAGRFAYAGRLGAQLNRSSQTLVRAKTGDEVTFGLAGGLRTGDGRWVVGPEMYGSTGISSGQAFFKKRSTPVEVLVGAHYRVASDWVAGAGVARGMNRGLGAPAARLVVSVEWAPLAKEPVAPPVVEPPAPKPEPVPEKDSDGDGIIDRDDACPTEPGVASDDKAKHGCAPPKDSDGDGIMDSDDACSAEAGVASDDAAKNGCAPPKDSDGDSIVDPDDACPAEAGIASEDKTKNGCPAAQIKGSEIVILEQVKFKTGSAKILKESDAILAGVAQILKDHPEMKKIKIAGHTDNKGKVAFNKKLSADRAQSVVKWLTAHGIDKGRLASEGFGQERPIADNATEDGRRQNRRVEFHISEK